MPKDDPVIKKIRETRHLISEKWNHDPRRTVEYYMELQKQYKDQLVDFTESEETAAKTE